MANYSGTVSGKGRAFQDSVGALSTNLQLVGGQKNGMMLAMADMANVIDGLNTHSDKTITATWTLYTSANPSASLSITV